MRLAYLGPPGTFGDEAAHAYAPDAERLACPSHAAVAAAVESGKADEGIVAIENSLNGSVSETLDILIHDTTLKIKAELAIPVVLNLIARPGMGLSDVRVIFSHPQPFGQSRRFLEEQFPDVQVEAALSTTAAVEIALQRDDAAAIGTARAAAIYGGEILAPGIQDADNNVTRFVVLGHESPPPTGRDRTSIAFIFPDDRPGLLAKVLTLFARAGINLYKIESRPTRAILGEYVFLVDFDHHQDDPEGQAILAAIRPLCAELKVFGSYPRM
ncbi:MAG: prephenate dehydratase [Dehalococcoidia bacterium]|nr:prephenate dehydratase [Dehalococcoidia bacterium]